MQENTNGGEKKGKLSVLKKNTSEIQDFGQGIHALQDSYAHKGTNMENHSTHSDVFPNEEGYRAALEITKTAINIHNLLSGDFKSVKTEADGSIMLKDIGGMNKEQLNEVFNKIKVYFAQK